MKGPATYADWVAVDWGTSNLRAWCMRGRDEKVAEVTSDRGMGQLDPDEFEPVLLDLIGDWLGPGTTPVIACGMVGSRQGWAEAGYRSTPCTPFGTPVQATAHDARIAVHILPGVKQSSPPDVMRGEETQIAGFIAQNPEFDGILCLPGTHTKWVHISAGEIVSFQTCMSGEMFALLSETSVLRHSTAGKEINEEAFAAAVSDTLSRPESLAATLFRIRARDLLEATGSATSRGTLSGALLGAELAATRPYWLGQKVALIGATGLSTLYAQALNLQGIQPGIHAADVLTLSGLAAAHAEIIS